MRDKRIHEVLDGERSREELDAAEQARLEALEAALGDPVAALRSTPVPDLTARVMSRLPDAVSLHAPTRPGLAGRAVRAGSWLWRPVSVRVRPVYALGMLAAAMLAGVLVTPRLPDGAPAAPIAAETEMGTRLYVQFRLEAEGASRVAVAGSFTDWRPDLELTEVSPGEWSAMIPLEPGVYDYTFIVDGTRMVVDPYAPTVADGFGGSNSRLFLAAPKISA